MGGLRLVLLALLAAACSSPSTRPEPRALPADVPELPVSLDWSRTFPVSSDLVSGIGVPDVPAVASGPDGTIFVVGDDRVFALDGAGEERWRADIVEDGTRLRIADGMAADRERLVLATLDGRVLALSTGDGRELWRRPLPGEVLAPPGSSSGIFFVHTGNGQIIALDGTSGKRLWVYSEVLPSLTLRGTSAPVVAGDKVFAGFANGRLVALDVATGSLLWTNEVGVPDGRSVLARMVDIDADPVVVDGVVYASAYQRRLLAASVVSGRTIWSRDISTPIDIAHDGRRLYLVDDRGRIWAVDRRNGEIVWRQDGLEFHRLSRPVVVAGRLLVADAAGYLHGLSLDEGAFVGRYRYDTEQERAPVLHPYGEGILLREPSGRLMRLTVAKGTGGERD